MGLARPEAEGDRETGVFGAEGVCKSERRISRTGVLISVNRTVTLGLVASVAWSPESSPPADRAFDNLKSVELLRTLQLKIGECSTE